MSFQSFLDQKTPSNYEVNYNGTQRTPLNYNVNYNKTQPREETPQKQMGDIRILINTELLIYNNSTDISTIQQEIIDQIVKKFDLIKCAHNTNYEVRDNTDLNFVYNDKQSAILCHNNMLVLFKNNLESQNSKIRETVLYQKLLTNFLTNDITFETNAFNFRKVIIKGTFTLTDVYNKQITSYDLKQQICNHLFRHFSIVNIPNYMVSNANYAVDRDLLLQQSSLPINNITTCEQNVLNLMGFFIQHMEQIDRDIQQLVLPNNSRLRVNQFIKLLEEYQFILMKIINDIYYQIEMSSKILNHGVYFDKNTHPLDKIILGIALNTSDSSVKVDKTLNHLQMEFYEIDMLKQNFIAQHQQEIARDELTRIGMRKKIPSDITKNIGKYL